MRQLLAATSSPFGCTTCDKTHGWESLSLEWTFANFHSSLESPESPTHIPSHHTAPVSSHSSSDRFLAVTSMGCFQQRSHGVYQKCRGPTYNLFYNMVQCAFHNRFCQIFSTPTASNLRIPASEHYSTVAPHRPCIFFHPQLKIRWMDHLVPRHVIQQYHLQFQGA